LQVDDDGFGGPRGSFPLYIAVSLGGALAATLAAIGFVTFQHVESSSAYVVSVHALGRVVPPTAVRASAGATATPRVVARRPPHPAGPAKLKVSGLPSAPPVAAAAVAAVPGRAESPALVPGVGRHRPTGASHVAAPAEGASDAAPAEAKPDRGDAAPAILTATSVATPAPTLPGIAVTVQAASPPPTEAAAPEPTPAVVAAAPAAVHSPAHVVEAHVKLAAEPDFPSDPSVAGLHGTSAVLVTIGPRGAVVNVALERSSGHASFDQAALNAARRTSYAAAVIDGKPATASYRMVYEFGQ